jgi:hypothetical protein
VLANPWQPLRFSVPRVDIAVEHHDPRVAGKRSALPLDLVAKAEDSVGLRPLRFALSKTIADPRLVAAEISGGLRLGRRRLRVELLPDLRPRAGLQEHHRTVVERLRVRISPDNEGLLSVPDRNHVAHNDAVDIQGDEARPEGLSSVRREHAEPAIAARVPAAVRTRDVFEVFAVWNDDDFRVEALGFIRHAGEAMRPRVMARHHAPQDVHGLGAEAGAVAWSRLPLPAHDG